MLSSKVFEMKFCLLIEQSSTVNRLEIIKELVQVT